MENGHFHTNIEVGIYSFVAALIGFNLVRIVAAPLAKREDWIGTGGRALGALVHF